jgi:hypothetical protein
MKLCCLEMFFLNTVDFIIILFICLKRIFQDKSKNIYFIMVIFIN